MRSTTTARTSNSWALLGALTAITLSVLVACDPANPTPISNCAGVDEMLQAASLFRSASDALKQHDLKTAGERAGSAARLEQKAEHDAKAIRQTAATVVLRAQLFSLQSGIVQGNAL